MFDPLLIEALNHQVRLQGIVERRRKQPLRMQLQSVEWVEDESEHPTIPPR